MNSICGLHKTSSQVPRHQKHKYDGSVNLLLLLLTDWNQNNFMHHQSSDINGRFLFCDLRRYCDQSWFTLLRMFKGNAWTCLWQQYNSFQTAWTFCTCTESHYKDQWQSVTHRFRNRLGFPFKVKTWFPSVLCCSSKYLDNTLTLWTLPKIW